MRLRRTIPNAFTLVEVLTVVAIISIAGAVVVPHIMSRGQMGVQAAGRIVISDIVFAQNEAYSRQAVRRVIFEPNNNRYRLADGTNTTLTVGWKKNGTAGQNYTVDFNQDGRFEGVLLENVDFGGDAILEFDELGSPMDGGTLELVADNIRYRITVAAFTGQVTIVLVP